MSVLTLKELKKIAQVSKIAVHEEELNTVLTQVEQVIEYVRLVQQCTMNDPVTSHGAVNVVRADEPRLCDGEILLARAPERADSFFVVPAILEHS